MNFDFRRDWRVAPEPAQPFDAKAPYIDNGTARPSPLRYHDPAWAKAEWERVWTKTWLLAGPSCDAREPGDWFRFDLGRESFIIVRGEDGDLNAMYNVCPHRGSRIALSDFGVANSFTCPFHSWQFGLDGQNLAVRDRETFRPEVLCHDLNMTRVAVEEVAGLIFISMNESPPPIRDWLGVVAEHLETYSIEKMVVIQHRQSEWGGNPNGLNAAQLLTTRFTTGYAAAPLRVGGIFTMAFTTVTAVRDYLPSFGAPGPLTANLLNPPSTPSGAASVSATSTVGVTPPTVAPADLASAKADPRVSAHQRRPRLPDPSR